MGQLFFVVDSRIYLFIIMLLTGETILLNFLTIQLFNLFFNYRFSLKL